MEENLYAILGFGQDHAHGYQPTEAEIKTAYKRLSMEHHPDREGGDEERFKQIKAAYEILSDPELRAEYDRTGKLPDPKEKQLDDALIDLMCIVLDHLDPERGDLVKAMQLQLDGTIESKLMSNQQLKIKILHRKVVMAKLVRRNGGKNFLNEFMQANIEAMELTIKRNEGDLENAHALKVRCAEFVYQTGPEPGMHNQFQSLVGRREPNPFTPGLGYYR